MRYFAVRRPAVQVRRRSGVMRFGVPPLDGHGVDGRLVAALALVADAEHRAVERQHVVVVVAVREAGVDERRRARREVEAVEPAPSFGAPARL